MQADQPRTRRVVRLPATIAEVEPADARDDAAPLQTRTALHPSSLVHDDDLLVVRPEPGAGQSLPAKWQNAHRDLAAEMVGMAHDRDVLVHVLKLAKSESTQRGQRTHMMFGVGRCPRQQLHAQSHAHDIDMDCVTSL